MLRLIKLLLLVLIAIVLVLIGMANMREVEVRWLPAELAESVAGVPTSLGEWYLSIVIGLAILLGILIGELIEWVREHKHRVTMRQREREAAQLRAENERLKSKLSSEDDLPKVPV